jgi:hypothetical protein
MIMKLRYFSPRLIGLLCLVLFFSGCNPYAQQVVPFKMPVAYPNVTQVAGIQIGARAFSDPNEAQTAFGFDIRGAGLFPVQLVIDHKGAYPVEINPSQTFLLDHQYNLWPVLEKRQAYQRVTKSSELAGVGTGAVKGGFLGAAAGALIGAAIGIVTKGGVGEAAGRGAAVGAAAGATVGGAAAYGSDKPSQDISSDLRNKALDNRPVRPMEIANGFIFFPGEAPSAREVRVQFVEVGTGRVYNVTLPL